VIGCLAAVLLAVGIIVVVLMNSGGGEDPSPVDPTSSATEESTGVPTTYVTQDPEDSGLGGSQLGGPGSGGNSLGG
jgi:serine/threonine-protein kinase